MSDDQNTDLGGEIDALRDEVAKLNNHRFIRLHDSVVKLGLFQLYRGLAFGFGSVLGATILVSVAGYLLAQIDFIPIIGDWASDIAKQIDAESAGSYGVEEEAATPNAIGDPAEGAGDDAQADDTPSAPPE